MRCEATTTANKANGARLTAPRSLTSHAVAGKNQNAFPAPQVLPDSATLRANVDYAGSV
jgi:hypothetical protein